MNIRRLEPDDVEAVAPLLADFRVALAAFKGDERHPDLQAAREELSDYLDKEYPVYVAVDGAEVVGYLVCRVEDDVVWAEHLFVRPSHRRQGIGGRLYEQAERLVEALGGDTLYNWVHPNNQGIIDFLRGRGYTVLNLVEVRRPRPGETLTTTVKLDDNAFDY